MNDKFISMTRKVFNAINNDPAYKKTMSEATDEALKLFPGPPFNREHFLEVAKVQDKHAIEYFKGILDEEELLEFVNAKNSISKEITNG